MPKKKSGTEDKIDKSQYVTALVGVLRARNENDFGQVAKLLEAELSKKIVKKGFGNQKEGRNILIDVCSELSIFKSFLFLCLIYFWVTRTGIDSISLEFV